jgi:hypothetical protein
MRCKFTFRVDGTLTLAENFPIETKFYRYEFIREQNLVTHLAVSLPVPNKSDWPEVVPNPAPGVKLELRVNTPHLPFVQLELRTLQGALAPYGVRAIDIEEPLVEWLPENEEERLQIGFNNYSRRSTRPDPNRFMSVPFDLIARAVIATDKLMEFETPLNFFRRGCRDIEDRQYVDAIYDFYFVLETLFSNGKFKTSAVVEEFLGSRELCAAVDLLLTDPGPIFTMNKTILAEFARTYRPLGREKLIEKLVELRGFLHHHTLKRKGIWKPEWQKIYELDALLFQGVAYNVVFGILRRFLWSQDVIDAFQTEYRKNQASSRS